MGTDIHGMFQARKDGTWTDIPSEYDQHRNYQLFAVLAGVRNGYGFAGTKFGDPVEPIASPRGLPEDFEMVDDDHPIQSKEVLPSWRRDSKFFDPGDGFWMGDHSFSWLTGEEMLAWTKKAPVVTHTGVIDRDAYEKWDKISSPGDYCGWISGPGIVVTESPEGVGCTHVLVSWPVCLKDELAYFFDEVRRLVELYGEVRFVFGFDS